MNREPGVILVVEDDAAHAQLFRRVLSNQDISADVHHVSDGQAALDYLFRRGRYSDESSSPRPDLIVLDIRLPIIDGFEVLRQIKSAAELQRIPVIMLSTSFSQQDVARAYELHANSYLVKPSDFDKFSAMIGQLWEYWLRWNQPAGA